MDGEYMARCARCFETFYANSRPPYSGRCGHSQCEDCARGNISCPVVTCSILGAFRAPKKNSLAIDYLELIDKEVENIIAVKKGIDVETSKLPPAPVIQKFSFIDTSFRPPPIKPVIGPVAASKPTVAPKPLISIPQPNTPVPKPRTNLKKMGSEPMALNKPPVPPSPTPSLPNSMEEHKIIITDLPAITEEMLKLRLGLKVIRLKIMTDFDGEPEAAFVWYATREDAEKAVRHNNGSSITGSKGKKKMKAYFFHKKAYEGVLINVRPANSVQYGTYLPGIPYNVTKEQILDSLQQMFGDKFYPNIHYPGKGFVMVNFKDDQTRHQYINTTRPLFSSSGKPQIKENKKEFPANQNEEFVEVVILKIPGGTTEQEVEKKFQLCGLTEVTMSNSDNYYVCATIRMTRSGFVTAKKFNGLEIEWDTKLTYPVPMQVMLKEQHDVEWREYGNTVLLKNYDPIMPLKEIEEKFFKSFGPDSVRVLRGNKKKTFLYVNIKEKSAVDKILAKSGEIYFGGAEPATFEPHLQEANVKPTSNRMKPTQSLQSIGTPRIVSAKTSTGTPWELVVKADCGMDAVKALFERIGTVDSFAYMASDNSYHIKLTPKF